MKTMSRRGIGSTLGQELRDKIDKPLIFKPLAGDPGHGYEAVVLIEVCDSMIRAGKGEK